MQHAGRKAWRAGAPQGEKGGTFGCLGWPGAVKNSARFYYFCPPNIFIIAACIKAWRLSYFV